MKESENMFCNSIYYKPFSHIYTEEQVMESKAVSSVISHFKRAEIIKIKNYRDVFNRPNQSFSAQKKTPALILAKKEGELVYKGAPFCQSFGSEDFYYTSFVLNCIYDCEYCYLRGMYASGNVVVFVNYEDFFSEVRKISENKNIFLCISYDTDLLALEGILGLCRRWYDFAAENKNVNIELRTKCGNIDFLRGLKPLDNFIIAFTLSPEEVIKLYEHKTASLEKRLEAARETAETGFPLRLSFDPLLKIPNFEQVYGRLIKKCFETLEGKKIRDIGVGSFRISPDYIKAMRKSYPNSIIAAYPYENTEGACSYSREDNRRMLEFMTDCIKKYCGMEKIYLWNT
ncbi:MAG: radical SAM protein [Clostridiales bacterium]|nr:radical SAM protein [Clostridiales bacterium]